MDERGWRLACAFPGARRGRGPRRPGRAGRTTPQRAAKRAWYSLSLITPRLLPHPAHYPSPTLPRTNAKIRLFAPGPTTPPTMSPTTVPLPRPCARVQTRPAMVVPADTLELDAVFFLLFFTFLLWQLLPQTLSIFSDEAYL